MSEEITKRLAVLTAPPEKPSKKTIIKGLSPFMPVPELLSNELIGRKQQLTWAMSHRGDMGPFIKDMEEEGPFPLWFDDNTDYSKGPSMYEWSLRLEPRLRADFDGNEMGCVTRAMLRFIRLGYSTLNAMQRDNITKYVDEGEETGILVVHPAAFFEQYSPIFGIGPSACAGLLCASTLQAIEREAA